MVRRRLLQVTAACNLLVLALGAMVVAGDLAQRPDVAFDGQAQPGARGSGPPEEQTTLPATGQTHRPLADPAGRAVDLVHHELDYLPPVVLTGVLGGDTRREGGCVWIEMDGQAQAIRWPQGYRAGFLTGGDGSETFELVDASGRVAAREGDTVWFTGARSGGPERLDRCHVGADHVWYVDGVGTEPP